MFIQIEPTPNPLTLKFLPGRVISKMKDMLNNDHRIHFFLLFSITLIVCGISLIIDSIINISLFKDNVSNQKITKILPGFIVREDLSINFISGKNNDKNNQSADQSINLNNFDLETVILEGKIPVLDLQTLPNELHLIKDVKIKKEQFIISILPAVVQENTKIRANRKRLLEIKGLLVVYKTLNRNDQQFLEHLASQYNINTLNKHKIDIIEALLESVDVIPNSIVLAQAANESGWGTSRFATEFNALFGEYTFDIKNGVEPIYRNNGEKHLIKFFSSINQSVGSYFKNLNTHSAYKDFREKRKQLRKNNSELDPIILVQYLKFYAKDKNYVKTIESIIKINKLIQFDGVKSVIRKS